MVFNRFRINCIIRVILLGATSWLFFYLLFRTNLYTALFILVALILYQIYALINYVEKTNRDLARFFQSIKYEDFSQTFKVEGYGSSFDSLKAAFSEVMNAFRKTRAEKEEHFRYLQTVVQHIGIGLIAFQPDGEVELINTAAKRLLNVASLKNIRSLESLSKPLVETLLRLRSRESALVKVEDENELLHLALYATEFKLRAQKFSLVSIQNIHSELEEKEMEAWQKLIRVLTHEIMNSITPIASLTSTISNLIRDAYGKKVKPKKFDSEALQDVQQALQTIQKRSQGLLHFVDAYRNLTLIPKPNFQIFPIQELFNRIRKLMQVNIEKNSIRFKVNVDPETLELTADPELVEQVLINLMLNAFQAVEGREDAQIELKALLDGRGRIIIQVADNGPGIPKENIEKVFVPFFSTKEGGSGIGLSFSRQILRLHNASIGVHSEPNVQTVFTLRF
ncbi:MAG: ATP-binding protein [Candidatus Aminicenantes bacterium]|nr:ATP-binding protein [Candidatus Aminicenantes bacterium]MDH5705829.1 ATP-binding protein [Candidatus Aminicenantes bacterium]